MPSARSNVAAIARKLLLPLAVALVSAMALWPAHGAPGSAAAPLRAGITSATPMLDLAHARDLLDAQAGSALPDATLGVPWENILWQSMPNFTWAACGVSANTRKVIDLALGQWSYAADNQDIPIRFSELPCTNGSTQAEIAVFEASTSELASAGMPPDIDVFGLTLTRDANGRICEVDIVGPCVGHSTHIYLFTDNWQNDALTNGQAAKTTAHEFGHAIGLAHARFCNYDSVMAQDCEPILKGLGVDDVQSINALVDYDLNYFGKTPLHAQAVPTTASGSGVVVTYHAGWNLVAGPRGTSFAAATSSLYTYLPTSTSYEPFPASVSSYDGYGYWAYFSKDTTVQLNGSGSNFFSADGQPGQWFLVGNENGTTPMRILGADAVQTYDPQSGRYQATTTLQPGQAAWVKVGKDGTIAVASTSLSKTQITCFLDLGSPASC
jgi:hypothetical protein